MVAIWIKNSSGLETLEPTMCYDWLEAVENEDIIRLKSLCIISYINRHIPKQKQHTKNTIFSSVKSNLSCHLQIN